MSVKEYHSLVLLVCPDFPVEVVQKVAKIVLLDDANDCLIAFVDFLFTFQFQVYYEGKINIFVTIRVTTISLNRKRLGKYLNVFEFYMSLKNS